MRLMRLERVVPPVCAPRQGETATKEAAPRPTYRDTIVLGVGDTQTFDPAKVAQSLRAKEFQAASTNAPQDAESPATDLPPPPTPARLRQETITNGPANRRTLAPREESASPWSVTADPDLSGAFTVDVEDYFHVTAFENDIPRERWDEYPSRVVDNTHRILDLLDRHQVHGTFFVLGWVAERFPRLVEAIHAAGHEVGSHGYWHRRIYRQTPDEFREDVQRSRDVLIDIIGQKVTAYRAPCFSIVKESLWALEILAEEGFEADCSIFPIRHDRYGIPGAERAVHRIATAAGLLWEFPAPTRRVAGVNVPASGGGYFRLLPVPLTVRCLKAARRQSGAPFAFYIHPWELDPDQPRLEAGSRTSRARHYLNLSSTEGKLEVLLKRFRFGRVEDVIAQLRPPRQCRLARPGALVDPTSILLAGQPQGNGHSNGHAPFLRAAPCAGCSCNPEGDHNGKSRCRAPVYQLAQDLNAKVEKSKVEESKSRKSESRKVESY
jgi:polysaccharide deacetylase family protein (PEP-CTERM system associated)